jgi:hypothetical protein
MGLLGSPLLYKEVLSGSGSSLDEIWKKNQFFGGKVKGSRDPSDAEIFKMFDRQFPHTASSDPQMSKF